MDASSGCEIEAISRVAADAVPAVADARRDGTRAGRGGRPPALAESLRNPVR